MKRILLSCLLSTVTVLPAVAALKEGDAAPDFTTEASLAGKAFKYSLKDALKKGPVIVYFYPSAYTAGCNIQAHAFATNVDKIAAAGATVVGVSLDNIARLNEFSADPEYCAGKLAVASDVDGKIAKSFDLAVREGRAGMKDSRGVDIDHGFAERTTFVLSSDGKVAATIETKNGVTPSGNVDKAIEAVQQLLAKKKG
jgi:thioredoxin-dependent peroxiredoxin